MKLTRLQLLELFEAHKSLNSFEFSPSTKWNIARNINRLKPIVEETQQDKDKLFRTYFPAVDQVKADSPEAQPYLKAEKDFFKEEVSIENLRKFKEEDFNLEVNKKLANSTLAILLNHVVE